MTRSVLRRSSAGLVLLALAFACSTSRPSQRSAGGARIYRMQHCSHCHGDERQGKLHSPPLTGLARHWTHDTLVEYLAAPASFVARDPRLSRAASRYSSRMGPSNDMTAEERSVLAGWLLEEDAGISAR